MTDKTLAFPITSKAFEAQQDFGMDLRDYFAAKAMQAIIRMETEHSLAEDVEMAYVWADAMMEERKKEK